MKIVHISIGRPKPESSNGIVKAVYFLAKEERKSCSIETWAISKHVDDVCIDESDYRQSAYVIPNSIVSIYRFVVHRLKELNRTQCDVIFHIHGVFNWPIWLIGLVLADYAKAYIISPHSHLLHDALRKNMWKKIVVHPIIKNLLKDAASMRALTPNEAADISKYFRKTIITIPNGVRVSGRGMRFSSKKRRFTEFIYVGRLEVYQKGLDLLLQGFRLVVNDLQCVRLTLVGPDCRGGRLELMKLVQQLGLHRYVTIGPPVYGKEKFDLLEKCQYFVQTSRFEGLAMGILEAMAQTKPVIITRQIDPFGVVEKDGCGYVVESSPSSIARYLQKAAMTHVKLRTAQGRAARRAVLEHFTWRRVASAMLVHYRDVLRRQRGV